MEDGLKLALERRSQRVANLAETISALNYKNFGNKITFEIGAGKGHYLSAYGAAFPNELCVGIDIISSRVRDGEKKNERRGNTNVHFIKAMCSEFLDAMPADLKFGKVMIFFPDPWPKKRHHKNRLIQPEFLSLLKKYCTAETILYFRTDHEEYFAWSKEIFENHPDWQILESSELPFEEVSQFQRILPVFQTLAAKLKA